MDKLVNTDEVIEVRTTEVTPMAIGVLLGHQAFPIEVKLWNSETQDNQLLSIPEAIALYQALGGAIFKARRGRDGKFSHFPDGAPFEWEV